ncbi:MAG: hypothetical protein FWD47_05705 [Treponema sp.]|nr:hypothetical protein [Treponema sp.]
MIICVAGRSFAIEISDLNGTWQPDWSYKAALELSEEEKSYSSWSFSWGEAIIIVNTTFEIDITADVPFICDPDLGSFPITNITQIDLNSIRISAFRASPYNKNYGFSLELILHFIDRNTFWIETNNFHGFQYEKGALWHRLSGPDQ